MFSVYGTSGKLFRGSMEQLRQIGGVGSLARMHRVHAVGRDGRDPADEPEKAFIPSGAEVPTRSEAQRNALASYAQTQQAKASVHALRQVRDAMSQPAFTLSSGATLLDAWHLLAQKSLGQAPVVDADAHLVGLLRRAELLRPERLPTADGPAWQAMLLKNVTELMFTPVPSVAADADIQRVARVLLDTGLPGLPVVDEPGLVIGFISRSDILRAVVTDPALDLWG